VPLLVSLIDPEVVNDEAGLDMPDPGVMVSEPPGNVAGNDHVLFDPLDEFPLIPSVPLSTSVPLPELVMDVVPYKESIAPALRVSEFPLRLTATPVHPDPADTPARVSPPLKVIVLGMLVALSVTLLKLFWVAPKTG
jgi:hypothetical protein